MMRLVRMCGAVCQPTTIAGREVDDGGEVGDVADGTGPRLRCGEVHTAGKTPEDVDFTGHVPATMPWRSPRTALRRTSSSGCHAHLSNV